MPGRSFEHTFRLDGTIILDGSARLGPCAENAVLAHQLALPDRTDLHTAGISTTPHLERARCYATRVLVDGAWQRTAGVIYVIDRARLAELGVSEHVVPDTVHETSLTEPEDAEVILVAADCGELPQAAVVEVLNIEAD